jgi:NAD(P)-dependent dehydrogenase (short-subunit alcohol dehydrogenase family)
LAGFSVLGNTVCVYRSFGNGLVSIPVVETPLLEASLANITAKTGRGRDQAAATLQKNNPQGRFVTPEEVAETVLWLCSPGAQSINGQAISISGGEV